MYVREQTVHGRLSPLLDTASLFSRACSHYSQAAAAARMMLSREANVHARTCSTF